METSKNVWAIVVEILQNAWAIVIERPHVLWWLAMAFASAFFGWAIGLSLKREDRGENKESISARKSHVKGVGFGELTKAKTHDFRHGVQGLLFGIAIAMIFVFLMATQVIPFQWF